MHDEKATGEIIFSVTQNLTCELPQFLRDFGDYACKLKNCIILSQFVIFIRMLFFRLRLNILIFVPILG